MSKWLFWDAIRTSQLSYYSKRIVTGSLKAKMYFSYIRLKCPLKSNFWRNKNITRIPHSKKNKFLGQKGVLWCLQTKRQTYKSIRTENPSWGFWSFLYQPMIKVYVARPRAPQMWCHTYYIFSVQLLVLFAVMVSIKIKHIMLYYY